MTTTASPALDRASAAPFPATFDRDVRPRERVTAASGVAFGILQLVTAAVFGAVILPRLGAPDAPAAHWVAAYRAHGELLRVGNYLLVLPTPLFLLFLGGLYEALRRAGAEALAAAGALAGAAAAMLWPLSAVLNDVAVDVARNGGDAGTVAALNGIGPYLLALGAMGRVVLLAVASAVLPRAGAAPRWVGILGYVAAGASAVGSLTLVDGRAFGVLALGTLAFDVWTLALGVALWRGATRADRVAGAAGAARAA